MEWWDVYIDIFVVPKTLQEVNARKEIPGTRDQEIGTISKDPTSPLDFKDLGLWLTKPHERTFTVIRIMADKVEINFYYKISFNKYMYKSNFT